MEKMPISYKEVIRRVEVISRKEYPIIRKTNIGPFSHKWVLAFNFISIFPLFTIINYKSQNKERKSISFKKSIKLTLGNTSELRIVKFSGSEVRSRLFGSYNG